MGQAVGFLEVLPVVAHRRADALGDPVDHDVGEEEVLRQCVEDVALVVAPQPSSFEDPRGQPHRRVVQCIGQRLGVLGLHGHMAGGEGHPLLHLFEPTLFARTVVGRRESAVVRHPHQDGQAQVHADHVLGEFVTELRRHAGPPVAPVRAELARSRGPLASAAPRAQQCSAPSRRCGAGGPNSRSPGARARRRRRHPPGLRRGSPGPRARRSSRRSPRTSRAIRGSGPGASGRGRRRGDGCSGWGPRRARRGSARSGSSPLRGPASRTRGASSRPGLRARPGWSRSASPRCRGRAAIESGPDADRGPRERCPRRRW